MSTVTRNWCRAAAMAVAPVLLLATFLYHPFLPGVALTPEVIAQAAEADPTRWATAHLLTVGALALFILAFQGLRGRLRDAGEEQWSPFAFPLIIVSGVLIATLPAIELPIAAAARTGIDTVALVEAVQPWFLLLLTSGSIAFLIGSLAFAVGIVRAEIMNRLMTALVVIALVVMALAMAAPPFAAFYVMGVAAIVAFWPLAWATVRAGSKPKAEAEEKAEPEAEEKAEEKAEAGDRPSAPRPRASEEQKGILRGFGRRGPRAHH